MFKKIIILMLCLESFYSLRAQKLLPFKLPDTGQDIKFISTPGEDADYLINPPSFTDNGDGTITDNNTRLMCQKLDGGEMTFESAVAYCKNLKLGGYNDWRLPTSIELFSINNYDNLNPALDSNYFTKTKAQYWWTSEKREDDTTDVWVVNAGGGIGAHPRTETVSAGGTKIFDVRAVRNPIITTFSVSHFTDNGNGIITDNFTGLEWQKIQSPDTMTWEEALEYSDTLSLAGKTDWRLPNVKELQSLNNVNLVNPSFDKTYFPNVFKGNYWSSTTMINRDTIAWDINVYYGIVSYNSKTLKQHVLLVRGGMDNSNLNITEVLIPAGEFEMGDHFGYVDPGHPSDEIPIHNVKIDSMYMTKTDITNQQYLTFLNSSLLKGSIAVKNNIVYLTGETDTLCYTNQYFQYYSISYDGKEFSLADFRAYHPMVGASWYGAAVFCNWLSQQNGLQECYNVKNWSCDFTKNGYRLPTEAEWEYAARGGHYNPYFKYPNGDVIDTTQTNLPNSGDPYETGAYPLTTPVGFYDGTLKQKSDFNWISSAASYQTSNGVNGFGLYDMQGNVWQLVNDWYENNYYKTSPVDNPRGPDSLSASIMPDGKRYRVLRGGNWYNGQDSDGVNDGHSRVSNRDPAYYLGPIDPKGAWSEVGFRIARKFNVITTGIKNFEGFIPTDILLCRNYPNPFKHSTVIGYQLSENSFVTLKVYDSFGQLLATLVNERLNSGVHTNQWNAENYSSGIYYYKLQIDKQVLTKKMILIK